MNTVPPKKKCSKHQDQMMWSGVSLGVWFAFPKWLIMLSIFTLYIFFGEMFIRILILVLFLKFFFFFFFYCWDMGVLCFFWILDPQHIRDLQIFPLVLGLSVFWWCPWSTEVLSFHEVQFIFFFCCLSFWYHT